jgi:hypothetical protein
MTDYYLRVEGVNLGNFVLDTQDLSTIRGGSFLLLDAVRDIGTEFAKDGIGEVISGGASSGLFRLALPGQTNDELAAQAKALRARVRAFLKKESRYRHATFVVDVVKEGAKFSTARARLIALNRWQQMRSPSLAAPTRNADAGVVVCEFDLVRPASRGDRIHKGDESKAASRSVLERIEYGRAQKQHFIASRTDRHVRHQFVRDLDELSEDRARRNLNHKIAVIYLDGNGFGKLQDAECSTAARQKEFDLALDGYRRAWLNALIDEMDSDGGWLSRDDRYRFEALQWAGDEISVIVPAWYGWRTLELLFNVSRGGERDATGGWEFDEGRAWRFGAAQLTFGAGLVFCHHNAPINRITRLAHDLGNLAKIERYEGEKKVKAQRNQFAYEILESFDHIGRDLSDHRRERAPVAVADESASRAGDAGRMTLSGDSMDEVGRFVSALKPSVPRRKLSQLALLLFAPPGEAEAAREAGGRIAALTEDVRAAVGHDAAAAAALAAFVESQAREGKGEETAWAHLAELWDYVG